MTRFAFSRNLIRGFTVVAIALASNACGIKGGLYLAPNQLPNAKPPAGSEDAKSQAAADAAKRQEQSTIPAAVLRNPATDSPAEMILDGSPY